MTMKTMTRTGTVLAATLLGVAFAAGAAGASPEVGKTAPEFGVTDSKGATHRLSDYRGKTVILEWTNHGCPYVRRHYSSGNMQALQKETTGEGVVWLSVISSPPGMQGHVMGPEADDLTVSRGAAPTAVLLDPQGDVGRLFDARTTPHMYVIDPEGQLVYNGAIDDSPYASQAETRSAANHVRRALDQLSRGEPVDPAVTRPYGCTVKYGS
jgi:hypothetical protein